MGTWRRARRSLRKGLSRSQVGKHSGGTRSRSAFKHWVPVLKHLPATFAKPPGTQKRESNFGEKPAAKDGVAKATASLFQMPEGRFSLGKTGKQS